MHPVGWVSGNGKSCSLCITSYCSRFQFANQLETDHGPEDMCSFLRSVCNQRIPASNKAESDHGDGMAVQACTEQVAVERMSCRYLGHAELESVNVTHCCHTMCACYKEMCTCRYSCHATGDHTLPSGNETRPTKRYQNMHEANQMVLNHFETYSVSRQA